MSGESMKLSHRNPSLRSQDTGCGEARGYPDPAGASSALPRLHGRTRIGFRKHLVWIELLCDLRFLESFIKASYRIEALSQSAVSLGIVRIEFNSLPVVFLHLRPVPRVGFHPRQSHPGLRKCRSQLQGSFCCSCCNRCIYSEARFLRAGQPEVGSRERGISLNCLLEVLPSLPQLLFGKSVQVIVALEIILQCLGIHWPSMGELPWVWRFDLCLDFTGDFLCQVSFECEYVMDVSLVLIGSQVPVRWTVNELCGDPHSVSRALYHTFDETVHIEVTRDFRQGLLGLFVLHG